MTEPKQISTTEYITPKTEEEIVTKAINPLDTNESETSLKQYGITKTTKIINLCEKKSNTQQIDDNQKQKWLRLELEGLRVLGTFLTQHIEQDITQKIELKEDLNVTMRNYEATVQRIADRYAKENGFEQQVDSSQPPTTTT